LDRIHRMGRIGGEGHAGGKTIIAADGGKRPGRRLRTKAGWVSA
jgi:hypothetical protein